MKPNEVDWEDVAREIVPTQTSEADILKGWGIEGSEDDVTRELANIGVERCSSCRVWYDTGDMDEEMRCYTCGPIGEGEE